MQVIRFILLWLILTFCFSLANHSYDINEILIQAINSILFVIGFYFSYRFLIKPFLYKGKVLKFFLLYILFTIFLSCVSFLSMYQVYVYAEKKFFVDNYFNEPIFFISNYILVVLVVSTLLSFRFLRDKMKTEVQLENLEKEKISTELNFLKAQINPHFLFNSLNNILFQIDKTNKDARETLLKFSEMLRYQLYECSTDLVEIEKELQYIKNYIEIQLLRKTDKYNCNFKVSDTVKKFQIAPLLLIPFIENAFKHISHHVNQKNCITISMDYKEGQFIFLITNDKDNINSIDIDENKGIGLANVKRRLDLLYDKKHQLEIKNYKDRFDVELRIEIV